MIDWQLSPACGSTTWSLLHRFWLQMTDVTSTRCIPDILASIMEKVDHLYICLVWSCNRLKHRHTHKSMNPWHFTSPLWFGIFFYLIIGTKKGHFGNLVWFMSIIMFHVVAKCYSTLLLCLLTAKIVHRKLSTKQCTSYLVCIWSTKTECRKCHNVDCLTEMNTGLKWYKSKCNTSVFAVVSHRCRLFMAPLGNLHTLNQH